jgi:hypothetical protein
MNSSKRSSPSCYLRVLRVSVVTLLCEDLTTEARKTRRANRDRIIAILSVALVLLHSSCSKTAPPRNNPSLNNLPPIILWAWERPEDLEFLDPNRFGVAFLAQTLNLKGDEVIYQPRHQPLKVLPQTELIAVTRIEGQKTTGERITFSPAQRERLVALILKTARLENVSAIQIDYDAAKSEREFYRALLLDLRSQLPDNMPVTMTALASFCIGDRWLEDLPVDEAVPMIFRMGTDDKPIKNYLAAGNDFREPLCQRSYGIALDEPLEMKFQPARRIYVFSSRSWTKEDVASIQVAINK